MAFGTQSDLARHLGVSRSAISQAFKKHNIQLSLNGEFDIEYAAWLLKEKQDSLKSKAQRSVTKQPSGLKDVRTQREILRTHLPSLVDQAVIKILKDNFNNIEAWDHDVKEFNKDMSNDLVSWLILWEEVKACFDEKYECSISDFPILTPDTLNFDPVTINLNEHIENILTK